jgi:hypothetical protein
MAVRETNPWDQRPNESSKAYWAFLAYRDQGPGRSLAGVRESVIKGQPATHVAKWSRTFDWVERAEAWDRRQAEIQTDQLLKLAREKATVWAKRREESRDRLWAIARGGINIVAAEIARIREGMEGIGGRVIRPDARELKTLAEALTNYANIEGSAILDASLDRDQTPV